ncbi:MAG: DUF362 domain-containing protein [bacterium]|nr:MAG: DUF362 domain-containing protein [bacterium]
MSAATVYFTNLRSRVGYSLLDKTRRMFVKSGFAGRIDKGDKVAVKLHFGEYGNTAFLPPMFAQVIVDEIKKAGGKPFLIDTNTLYKGSRGNAIDHLETAFRNGFSYATVGAPVIIGDGLIGMDYVREVIDGKHFKDVKIAAAFHHADAVVNMTHFTAHELFGFGGAVKGIGMGCAAPSGKQEMHSDVLPEVNAEKCTSCGRCYNWCPVDAIDWEAGTKAQIIQKLCIGCGECTVACTYHAIAVNWKTDPNITQEKTAEYAYGALKNKDRKALFFSYLMNVSPDCDCYGFSDPPFVPDIGIMVSEDPVALDQAAVDHVNRAQPLAGSKLEDMKTDDKVKSIHGIDWRAILAHGEAMGLGKREYRVEEIE